MSPGVVVSRSLQSFDSQTRLPAQALAARTTGMVVSGARDGFKWAAYTAVFTYSRSPTTTESFTVHMCTQLKRLLRLDVLRSKPSTKTCTGHLTGLIRSTSSPAPGQCHDKTGRQTLSRMCKYDRPIALTGSVYIWTK